MTSDAESQKIEFYNATVHMNNKVYYVTIPKEIIRKMSIKKNDLVAVKVAHTTPPEGF